MHQGPEGTMVRAEDKLQFSLLVGIYFSLLERLQLIFCSRILLPTLWPFCFPFLLAELNVVWAASYPAQRVIIGPSHRSARQEVVCFAGHVRSLLQLLSSAVAA